MRPDLVQGLGIWEHPYFVSLNVPALLASLKSNSFNEPVFAALTVVMLFLSTWFLARELGLSRTASEIAGVFLAFSMFMPSPFGWVGWIYHHHSPGSHLSLFSLALAWGLRLQKQPPSVLRSNWVGVMTQAMLVLLLGLHGLLLAPVVLPLLAASMALGLLVGDAKSGRFSGVQFLPLGVTVAASVLIAAAVLQVLPLSYHYFNRAQSTSWATDSLTVVPPPITFAAPSLLPTSGIYRMMILGLVAVGTYLIFLHRHATKTLAVVVLGQALLLATYTSWFYLRASQGVEVGPNPSYVGLFQLPLVAICCTVPVGAAVRACRRLSSDVVSNLATSAHRVVKKYVSLILVVGLASWLAVWVTDNRELREPRSDVGPIRGTVISTDVARFVQAQFASVEDANEDRQPWPGRVLLIQQPSYEFSDGSTDRTYPSPWLQDLFLQFLESGIPMFNVYHHFETGRQTRLARTVFSDGHPFLRNWYPLNGWGPSASRVASLLGIRFVISQEELTDSSLNNVFKSESGWVYRVRAPNLQGWNVSQLIGDITPERQFTLLTSGSPVLDDSALSEGVSAVELVPAESTLSIEDDTLVVDVMTRGRSLVVLPFEFSHCMRVYGPAGSTSELLRVNYLMTGLFVDAGGRFTIKTSAQLWDTCLTRDHHRH